jgi:tetratricopeptide (TPR) repeat protein
MRRLTTRRVLILTAVPLILAQLGCAARRVRVPSGLPQGTITETDREACDEYAKKQKTKSVVGLSLLGVLAIPVSVGLAGVALVTSNPGGVAILGAGPAILGNASKNATANRATREAALRECLEPLRLEQAVGPEDPALAESIITLAHGYTALGDLTRAEPLYQRALAIQEKTLGPDHPDVGRTLQGYAALLRKAQRDTDAAELDARIRAIQAHVDQSHETDAATESGVPPAESEPAALSVP